MLLIVKGNLVSWLTQEFRALTCSDSLGVVMEGEIGS